jgi:predicted Zn-dependent peptidase
MEHLAFGANEKFRSEQEYETEFTKNGAYHNAWTSDFLICYEAECADFEWERIFGLQRVAICQPRFNEKELAAEKGNVKSELTGYQNDYGRLLWPKLQQEVGEEVLLISERIKTLGNIVLGDVREHHRRTHTTENMRFIITGRLHGRKKQILRALEEWELRQGERFEVPADKLRSAEPVLIRRKDASNLTFGVSWILPRKLGERELFAMGCLNHILNGTTSSRMFGQARRRGLIYGMGSMTGSGVRSASWDFDGEVNVESAAELFDLIATELGRVRRGDFSEEEIAAAKSYALGRHQMGAQTAGQISDYYAEGYFAVEEVERYDKVPERIAEIRVEEMTALAEEFLGRGFAAMVGVSNVEVAVLRGLGEKIGISKELPSLRSMK